MLLIFDEAQTGLGKTGHMFGFQHEGVVPDIMALSKHFGGGVPVSAVCTTAEIAKRAVASGFRADFIRSSMRAARPARSSSTMASMLATPAAQSIGSAA